MNAPHTASIDASNPGHAAPVAARSLTVAIPALNEEENIEVTIRTVLAAAARVAGLHVEVLVVDDGSTDRTAEIVRGLSGEFAQVRLLQNPQNIGLGASIRRAIEAAGTEKFLFIPGDNDIPPSALDLLIGNAYAADIVMVYFHNDECRGRMRYLMSTLFKLIYTTVFDLYVQYINGPAVYPVAQLRALNLHSTRFSIVAEINVKLLRQGLSFVEFSSNRQTGLYGSTSFTLRTLVETARVFLQVFTDVYRRDRPRYAHRPVRLTYEVTLSKVGPPAAGPIDAR
jgi:glycosyltransferase involved in cell wall biosynthesis